MRNFVIVSSGAVAIFATLWALTASGLNRVEAESIRRCDKIEQQLQRTDDKYDEIISRLSRIEALLESDQKRR